MQERILVATDFSEIADNAVKEAHVRANATSAAFGVCHVLPNLQSPHSFLPQENSRSELDIAAFDHQAFSALEERVHRLTGRDDTMVDLFVDVGIPYAEIVKRAEQFKATLIVVSSQGKTGVKRLLLGSVAEQVVRHAHCPVEVLRPSYQRGTVVAATDLSDPSLPAIEAAAREAKRREAKLVVCFAIDFAAAAAFGGIATVFGAPPSLPSNAAAKEIEESARSLLRGALARFGAEGEALVLEGPAAASVCHLAEERNAELVVVSTRGRTGLSRMALGSVAESIIRHAPCSVLAVRHHS